MLRRVGLQGMFRLVLRDSTTGIIEADTGWFENLILNVGMTMIGESFGGFLSQAGVGTSNATPVVTQTTLQAQTGTGNQVGSSFGYHSSPPYYDWTRVQNRIAAGVATGNIAEVGVKPITGSQYFARAVVSPVLVKAPTQTLDVYYELRHYPPTGDVGGNITLGSSSYAYTLRAAHIDVPAAGAPAQAYWLPGSGVFGAASLAATVPATGAIGTIHDSPSGLVTNYGPGVWTEGDTTNNGTTWTKSDQLDAGLSVWNIPGGFKSLQLGFGACTWQVQFTPNVVKTALDFFSLVVRVSWTRYTP